METKNKTSDLTNQGIALALSGGGKRAALFQCGGIMAMAVFGRLSDVSLVSAISGGSLAALALKRAFAENRRLSATESGVAIAWSAHDFLIRQVAPHNYREEATLATEHIVSFLAAGELRLTESISKQIKRQLKGIDIDAAGPETFIGVCKLGTKDLVHVRLTGDNAGITTAAAMALPGLFDAEIVEPIGAVIDGGVVDKTGLKLLSDIKWTQEIVLLDASQVSKIHSQSRVNSMAALQATLEVEAEALRPILINRFGSQLKTVSLRDGPISGLDSDCVEHLKGLRTDLDHFSPVETDSLIVAGFVATCIAFGDEPAAAHTRLSQFATSSEGFARNLARLSRGIKSINGVVDSQSTNARLLQLLKMGKSSFIKELLSKHPYLRLSGIFSLLMTPFLFAAVMALLFTFPLTLAAFVSGYSGWSLYRCIGVAMIILGILTASYLKARSRESFSLMRWIVLTLSAPLIIASTGALRYSVQRSRSSASVSSIVYPLAFLGRVWELVDPSQYIGKRFTRHTLLQITASTLLIALLIVNPFFINSVFHSLLPAGEFYTQLSTAATSHWYAPNSLIVIVALELVLWTLSLVSNLWERCWK